MPARRRLPRGDHAPLAPGRHMPLCREWGSCEWEWELFILRAWARFWSAPFFSGTRRLLVARRPTSPFHCDGDCGGQGGWPGWGRGGPPPAVQVVWTCERGVCVGGEGVTGWPRGTSRSVGAACGSKILQGGGPRRACRRVTPRGAGAARDPPCTLPAPRVSLPSPVSFSPLLRCLPCPRDARPSRVLRFPAGMPAWRRARLERSLP